MFKKPEAEIVLFATQDIVTTSPGPENGGGDEAIETPEEPI